MVIAISFRHLGPYHHARLRAVSSRYSIVAVEFSALDNTYGWSRMSAMGEFDRVTLFDDADAEPAAVVRARVAAVLDELNPAVVAIPGWSHPAALATVDWCCRRRTPAILMSDTTALDRPRNRLIEAVKRRIVNLFSAALVAGTPHADYLRGLGFPEDRIFTGYDVVDNQHFLSGASAARGAAEATRARLGLPEHYFLASSRFIERKNLPRLLEAYKSYRMQARARPWQLVLLGSGCLEATLLGTRRRLGLSEDVIMPGFRQYSELPAYYGLAGAFVHASTSDEQWGLVVNEAMASGLPVIISERCGSASELVRDGVNGYTFDPYNIEQLAALMLRVAAADEADREEMGRASRAIIADWDLDRFADGTMRAAKLAMIRPVPEASWLNKVLIRILLHRPSRLHRR